MRNNRRALAWLGLLGSMACKQLNYIPSSVQIPYVDSSGQLAVYAYGGAGAFEFAQAGGGLTVTPWKGLLVQLQGSGYTSGTSGSGGLSDGKFRLLSFSPPPDTSFKSYNLIRRGNSLGAGIGWMFNSRHFGKVFVSGGFSSEFTSRALSQTAEEDRSAIISENNFYGSTRAIRYWCQIGSRIQGRILRAGALKENLLLGARLSIWQIQEAHTDFRHVSGPITTFKDDFVKWPGKPLALPEFMVAYELAYYNLSGQAQLSYCLASPVHNWLAPPFLSLRLGLTYRFPFN